MSQSFVNHILEITTRYKKWPDLSANNQTLQEMGNQLMKTIHDICKIAINIKPGNGVNGRQARDMSDACVECFVHHVNVELSTSRFGVSLSSGFYRYFWSIYHCVQYNFTIWHIVSVKPFEPLIIGVLKGVKMDFFRSLSSMSFFPCQLSIKHL